MAVLKYLDVSTGNLSQQTAHNPRYLIADYKEGFFVFVPEEIDGDCPEDLAGVLKHARGCGCAIVRFDCDADLIDGLPSFDW